MKKHKLTAASLRELLHYDESTGHFSWKVRLTRVDVGTRAGSTRKDGYVGIKVLGVVYGAHRLAHLWVTGEWPESQVDHRNGVRSDNAWTNLRCASPSLNSQNLRKARRNNRLGVLGVRKVHNRYQARITVGSHLHTIGAFETSQLAHAAYVSAKRLLHAGCTL